MAARWCGALLTPKAGPMGGMFMGVKSQPIPGSPGPSQVSAQRDKKALFWGREGPPFKPLLPTHEWQRYLNSSRYIFHSIVSSLKFYSISILNPNH